jgi:hypothetical protein
MIFLWNKREFFLIESLFLEVDWLQFSEEEKEICNWQDCDGKRNI